MYILYVLILNADFKCCTPKVFLTWLLYLNDMTVSFVKYHANVTNIAATINKIQTTVMYVKNLKRI